MYMLIDMKLEKSDIQMVEELEINLKLFVFFMFKG